ncbi:MAG: bifunctional phosphopantothenoylcysteine decarboxylase/phosphopantothenate--cysteine ligase CoaBC [Eubacteriales bacterium]|nr:bifunctional phosphopantothenoylcysteine decarboxylase/phosphopantothenate--cysteine ligase CoaBC [Eubacteriales bacterium]
MMLTGKKIVVGVTGGIAAYKACELVSRLKKRGAQVRVVLTEHACQFVQPLTFETLSGNPAYTDSFDRKYEIGHVALAKWADLLLIAPATANCMAKMACGIADDLLSTTCLAVRCPVLVAPAMNSAMWRNPATQANLELLRSRGLRFVGPEAGRLACGDDDVGRMSEPEQIVKAVEAILNPLRDLEGLNVLVTAGPTVERIDPVRYITNRSTGKMGYALAEAARDRGANVTLVSGPTSLTAPQGVEFVRIESSAQLCAAVLERGESADVVIQAAAPADFRPKNVSDRKIKKTGESMTLELEATTDIAAELGRRKQPGQILVAFAAETNDVMDNARGKLAKKNADLIVANDVSRSDAGFGVDTNVITLITAEDVRALEKMSKRAAADAILSRVRELRDR